MNERWVSMLATSCALFALVMISGCSSEQMYNAGSQWRRNECNTLQDQDARQRCLRQADTRYEDYKKEVERDKK